MAERPAAAEPAVASEPDDLIAYGPLLSDEGTVWLGRQRYYESQT